MTADKVSNRGKSDSRMAADAGRKTGRVIDDVATDNTFNDMRLRSGGVRRDLEAGGRLAPHQRQLVRENIGLVVTHLRRRVPNLDRPRRRREWDDLFQEGCMGLIRAAVRWDPASGIPFAAFALARIQNAVGVALRQKFTLLAEPEYRARLRRKAQACGDDDWATGRRVDRHRPQVVETEMDAGEYAGRSRSARSRSDSSETISERIRAKYQRAVRFAGDRLSRASGARADRAALVRCLAQERMLVAEASMRTPLRQIARQTGSSFARVAQCGHRYEAMVEALLRLDPELACLNEAAHEDGDGLERLIDADLERRLREGSARALADRFRQAGGPDRQRILYDILVRVHGQAGLGRFVENSSRKLSPADREAMLWDGLDRVVRK